MGADAFVRPRSDKNSRSKSCGANCLKLWRLLPRGNAAPGSIQLVRPAQFRADYPEVVHVFTAHGAEAGDD